jgi:isocitrate dehydrogenase kinase/phosphatase
VFLEQHADLMDPAFRSAKQERIRAGLDENVNPYLEEIRFSR